ncbi:hypothetical protein DM01DRAFT_170154 [Hesseltinella vesiculosa]|uniref:Uncharacterized protein n=1 Tax=Hesseltinella vesiculosa TaxID=101127 RepID=A0A1X2GBH0_9FUNG|nr:hypothetical protein DM01DRAFT_170154 [Hesseltinella vesiculosa]
MALKSSTYKMNQRCGTDCGWSACKLKLAPGRFMVANVGDIVVCQLEGIRMADGLGNRFLDALVCHLPTPSQDTVNKNYALTSSLLLGLFFHATWFISKTKKNHKLAANPMIATLPL